MRITDTLPIIILDYSWMALGIFFLVLWWRTNKIKQRESKPLRVLDKVLIWGGYIALLSLGPVNKSAGGAWSLSWRHWNLPLFLAHPALQVAGLAVAMAGLLLTGWARGVLGRYWSGTVALKQDHRLISHGPYRFVRHPLYSGLLLAAIGTTLVLDGAHCLLGLALLLLAFVSRARREDALLASEFGPTFAAYRRRTGLLVPGL